MDVWLDTCSKDEIEFANRFGFVCGVTTNPSILAAENEDVEKIINTILDAQDGPVAVQIISEDAASMIKKAHLLHSFSDRIVVKLPVLQEGLIAMKALAHDKIPIMATAAFHPSQVLLAGLAGADYVAPYVGRMANAGLDIYEELISMKEILKQYNLKTKIIGALKTTDQIVTCAEIGIHAVTLKPSLFRAFVANDDLTLEAIKSFNKDWQSRRYTAESVLSL